MMSATRPRRIGLSRNENLGYNLHSRVRTREQPARASREAAASPVPEEAQAVTSFDHPPESSSSDELAHASAHSPDDGSDDGFVESLRPTKRRKITATSGPNRPSEMRSDPVVETKRKLDDMPDSGDEEPFARLSSSQGSRQRRRGTYGHNIHAAKVYGSGGAKFKKPAVIPRVARKREEEEEVKKKKKNEREKDTDGQGKVGGFRAPKKLEATVLQAGSGFKKPLTTSLTGLSSPGKGPASAAQTIISGRTTRVAAKTRGEPLAIPSRFKAPHGRQLLKAAGFEDPALPEVLAKADTEQLPVPSSGSTLSSLPSDIESLDDSISSDEIATTPLPEIASSMKCPVCRQKVLASVYESFVKSLQPANGSNRRLNMRQQSRFCRHHKERAARIEWTARNYPDIDWGRLADRVRALDSFIQDIIESRVPSHFTDRLLGTLDGDGRRHKVTSEVGGTLGADEVGYYGGRGARLISETLIEAFSKRFREITNHEGLVAAGGISGYVQKVLVPEVTTRLVQEDLACDGERAREVLAQSAELGRWLCEEENDQVDRGEETDDEPCDEDAL